MKVQKWAKDMYIFVSHGNTYQRSFTTQEARWTRESLL